MKLDLCNIAEVYNEEPQNYTSPIDYLAADWGIYIIDVSMEVFCHVKRNINKMIKARTLDPSLEC